jgi:hypothetical protein
LLSTYYATSHCYNYLNLGIVSVNHRSVNRTFVWYIFAAHAIRVFTDVAKTLLKLFFFKAIYIIDKYWSLTIAKRQIFLEWNLDASIRSLAYTVAKQVHDYLHKSFLIRVNASWVIRIKVIGNAQFFHLTNTTVNINTILQQIINWKCRKIYLTLFYVHLGIVY